MWDNLSQARGARSGKQSGFPGSSPLALRPCLDEHKQAWLFIVGEDTLEGDGTLPTQFSSKFLFFVQTLQACVETGLASELIQSTTSPHPPKAKGWWHPQLSSANPQLGISEGQGVLKMPGGGEPWEKFVGVPWKKHYMNQLALCLCEVSLHPTVSLPSSGHCWQENQCASVWTGTKPCHYCWFLLQEIKFILSVSGKKEREKVRHTNEMRSANNADKVMAQWDFYALEIDYPPSVPSLPWVLTPLTLLLPLGEAAQASTPKRPPEVLFEGVHISLLPQSYRAWTACHHVCTPLPPKLPTKLSQGRERSLCVFAECLSNAGKNQGPQVWCLV